MLFNSPLEDHYTILHILQDTQSTFDGYVLTQPLSPALSFFVVWYTWRFCLLRRSGREQGLGDLQRRPVIFGVVGLGLVRMDILKARHHDR